MDRVDQNASTFEDVAQVSSASQKTVPVEAAGDDEVSFDPDDIISDIEIVDDGWWRGVCKCWYGLFPANYVELRQ
ncbi:src substrate cortactin-like [Cavia porcellus]|uniref:src substrate cortactin-like n=1 Tax=Cavia porcellus TaxID=10141 RepID=UPI002FE3F58E